MIYLPDHQLMVLQSFQDSSFRKWGVWQSHAGSSRKWLASISTSISSSSSSISTSSHGLCWISPEQAAGVLERRVACGSVWQQNRQQEEPGNRSPPSCAEPNPGLHSSIWKPYYGSLMRHWSQIGFSRHAQFRLCRFPICETYFPTKVD